MGRNAKRILSNITHEDPPEHFKDHGPCWVWGGRIHRDGYGQVKYKGRSFYVHKLLYILLVRKAPVPEGYEVDHRCHRRACCNPEHLEMVTKAVNLDRRQNTMGREAAEAIRASDRSNTELAAEYGVSAEQIRRIKKGERWT